MENAIAAIGQTADGLLTVSAPLTIYVRILTPGLQHTMAFYTDNRSGKRYRL